MRSPPRAARPAGTGHLRGRFESALIGTMAWSRRSAIGCDVPWSPPGGIMDGRGIAAALALGADGAQMGTAFIGCDETRAPCPTSTRSRSRPTATPS